MKFHFWRRKRRNEELDEELRGHLTLGTREEMEAGRSRREAELAARREFGNETLISETTRDMWGWKWFTDVLQDARYGLRMLRKSPGFAAVAILTLALGIGANSAIFSVVNSVLLRPLPYREASRLVWVGGDIRDGRESYVSYADYFSWRKQCAAFQEITEYQPAIEYTLTGAGDAERIAATRASYSFLRTLDAAPQLGRDISPEDDVPNGPRVALMSDSLWRRRFSADPATVGRTITLDGNLYVVIGVLPAGFEIPEDGRSELLIPFQISEQDFTTASGMFGQVIARLRPGVSAEAAAADAQVVARAARSNLPEGFILRRFADSRVFAIPLHDFLVGDVRKALLLLLGAVGFVLLIACANVASLQLARAAAREKEIAVRAALGAGRWRIARQLLTECTLTGFAGGLAGVALGVWLVALVRRLGPKDIPHLSITQMDGRVLAFTLGVSIAAAILFGLAPVASAFRVAVNDSMKQGGAQGSAGKKVVRPQQVLMTMELGMALVLLIGAGLLARSFVRLISAPIGFDSHGVLTGRITLPASKYLKDEQQREFYSELFERLQGLPGVTIASGGSVLPFGGRVMATVVQQVEGRPKVEMGPGGPQIADVDYVAQGYFEALQIPLKAGRFLERQDGPNAPQVMVVNETFARTFLPNENAVGHRVRSGGGDDYTTIVGVVADTPQRGVAAKVESETYRSIEQAPFGMMELAVRTADDPGALVPAVRQAVAQVDRDVPLYKVETLDETIAGQVASQRFNLSLLGAFAGLALLLASVGIYGVMTYAVGQRRQEIGIRMALGAQRENVLNMILGQGAKMAAFGLAIGVGASFALTRLLRTLLFEVTPTDTLTFAWSAMVLLGVAMLACWIPARRASRLDPMTILRDE
jgi:putative ABC transport system permease protein